MTKHPQAANTGDLSVLTPLMTYLNEKRTPERIAREIAVG
jgi:hypothetical protein